MAIKLTNTKEATAKNGIKVCVYGQAGAGKTVLCATTPNLKNTIYFCLKLKRQRWQSDQMATNPT